MLELVETFIVLLPEPPVIGFGLNEPLAPEGRPVTLRLTLPVKLPEGVEMVMPGDNINIDVELITPIAAEEGLRFAIREGGRTVGAGVVTKILE